MHDGLGRLICKETLSDPLWELWRTDDHYYDGVRRIQQQTYEPPEIIGGGGLDSFLDGGGFLDGRSAEYFEREYIYGPDYVDEFVLQTDRDGDAVYMLQDANYNVVATLDDAGAVLKQWQYEPYGEVTVVNKIATAPPRNDVTRPGNRNRDRRYRFAGQRGRRSHPC
ncbi:MAG: hypothetical protein KKB50_10910 [Planctomycetes bacterium]|nr:hypothetical protein [Planctomycetota bacterium]